MCAGKSNTAARNGHEATAPDTAACIAHGLNDALDGLEKPGIATSERLQFRHEIEGPEAQQHLRASIGRRLAITKRMTDSSIEEGLSAIKTILGSLEIKSLEEKASPSEKGRTDPEEILNQVRNDLTQVVHPNAADISGVISASGAALKDVQIWLADHHVEMQSLVSFREQLETQRSILTKQLFEEESNNFFRRVFRGQERRALTAKLEELSERTAQVSTVLDEQGIRGRKVEAGMQEILDQRKELAFRAVERFFDGVVGGYISLKKQLSAPDVKRALNDDLIAQRVAPELERLREEDRITKEEAHDYLSALREQLAEGGEKSWDELIKREKGQLGDLRYLTSCRYGRHADEYYDKIIDVLIRQTTKERIEALRATLAESIIPEHQERLNQITEEIINPRDNERSERGHEREVLDLTKLPIDDLMRLKGLERWEVVKEFAASSGVIPLEIFSSIETVLIKRWFDEQLFPGGRESYEGTEVAGKLRDLGNPAALPLMLRHIETWGAGHTSTAVLHVMEDLLKKSSPGTVRGVLESMPRGKKELLEILADEASYMNRYGKYQPPALICLLLQNGDVAVARERLAKVFEKGGQRSDTDLRNFYWGYTFSTPENIDLLLQARAEVERVIIEGKLGIWTHCSDRLLAALVNPRNGQSVAFPKRIAQEGLGISDEKILGTLDQIFETKDFKRSGFEREAFLDGLVMLNSKEDGKVVLETLLGAYRGTRNDPPRIRRVFQLLSTLDRFGEYEFVVPSPGEITGLGKEIKQLEKLYSQEQDKTKRKKLKNRMEELSGHEENLTGLKGIEDAMAQRVVEVACRRLDLPQQCRDKIKDKLDELLQGGAFEIIPSLAGKYEGRGEKDVKDLLREITAHMIEGDFQSWRYSHEQSQVQLDGLSDRQQAFWRTNLEPIVIEVELSEGEKGRREDELRAAQQIIKNAKEHILVSQPHFDFSAERRQVLTEKVRELTEHIKSSTSESEKKGFALEKRGVEAEFNLVNGILEVENATVRSITREKILTHARELQESINKLKLPLAGLDIEQLAKIFTVGTIKSVIACESDDALTLLKVGVEPQETCQSWRNGGFNECLLAYVADSNKKVLNVTDGDGRIVARSIIKLTSQRDGNDFDSKTERKALLVERPYSLLPNAAVYRAFCRALFTKAQGLDASITFASGLDDETLRVFEEEAQAFGYQKKVASLEIFIPPSLNRYEYSDTLGGKISEFNRFKQLEVVSFEKSET